MRLTNKDGTIRYLWDKRNEPEEIHKQEIANQKLGQLEDIEEEFEIDSIEDLRDRLTTYKFLANHEMSCVDERGIIMNEELKALKEIKQHYNCMNDQQEDKDNFDIIEKELKAFNLIKPLLLRVDYIGDNYYLVLRDEHYIMIGKRTYKLLEEILK